MDTEVAHKITSAACALWFFREGIKSRVAKDDVRLIQSLSVGQIQTAGEVVEARNNDVWEGKPEGGNRTIYLIVEPSRVVSLKEFADGLGLE